MEEFLTWFNPENIVATGGVVMVAIIIYLESGVFFGFFLPGDSLLFTTGLLSGTGLIRMPVEWTLIILTLAAFFGFITGYFSGKWFLRSRIYVDERYFFRKKYFSRAAAFLRLHKGSAFIIARFIPLIRTFLPILAGATQMKMREFLIYNILGSIVWVVLIVLSGYYLGRFNPSLLYSLEWIVIALIVITAYPIVKMLIRKRAIRIK